MLNYVYMKTKAIIFNLYMILFEAKNNNFVCSVPVLTQISLTLLKEEGLNALKAISIKILTFF